ncbi:MAG: MoxR family ATPase [Acidianus infernus]|nr:MoxR family ATPase [Acidianus infernus]
MSQQPSGQGISEKIQNLASKYGQMLNELNKAVVGRYDSKTAVLLGLMTGFPTLLVGDRGVAKTMLIELLPKVIDGLTDKDVFVVQVSEYTDPSEIFGVPDIQKLVRGEGFDLKTDGFLPSAKVAFIDEIFYTSEKVRSTLLRAINEKKINVFGKEIKLPWIAFYAAANKVDLENPSDLALLDRFNIRGFILDIPFIMDNVDRLVDETVQVMNANENPELKKVISLNDVEETRKVLDQMVRDFFNSKEASDLLKKVYYVVGDILASLKDTDAYEYFYRSADEDYTHISTRTRKRLNYVASSIALVRGATKPTYLDYLLALLFTIPVDVQTFKIVRDKIRDEWNKAVSGQEDTDTTKMIMDYLNDKLLTEAFIKASKMFDTSRNAIENLGKKISLTNPFKDRESKLVNALPKIVEFLTSPKPIPYSIWLLTKDENGNIKFELRKTGELSGNPFQKLEELLKLLEDYRKLLDEAYSPKERKTLIIGLSKLVVNFGSTSSIQSGFKVPFLTLLDAISLFINNLKSTDVQKVIEQVVNDAKNNALKSISNGAPEVSGWEVFAPLLEQYGMKVPGILEAKRQIEERAKGLSKNLDNTVTGIMNAGEKIMEIDEEMTKTFISLAS